MHRLTVTQKKWLVAAHVLSSIAWVGPAFCYIVLATLAATTLDPHLPHAIYAGMRTLAQWLVLPAALLTLVTGLMLSLLTNWGLFKWYWIIVKVIVTPLAIGLETFALDSVLDKAVAITAAPASALLLDPNFVSMKGQMFQALIPHLITMSAIVVISVIKPWGQRKQRSA